MATNDLKDVYRSYIACLNARDFENLGRFVHEDVQRNGERLGLAGYREMLRKDVEEIPDLRFDIELLLLDGRYVASRLAFHCTPKGEFLGLPVNGKRVFFTENVFYRFEEEKIVEVSSVIDKAAIEAQL